jgi:hypothetical protein
MGGHPNVKYGGCCFEVFPHHVAWEGIGEDTKGRYSARLREISQNAFSYFRFFFSILHNFLCLF